VYERWTQRGLEDLVTRHDATLPSCCAPILALDVVHSLRCIGIVRCAGPGSDMLEVQSFPFRVRPEHFRHLDLQKE
jgi:hypothetical protein